MKRVLMILILAGAMALSACGATSDEHGHEEILVLALKPMITGLARH